MRRLTYALLIILLATLLAACAEVEQPCECITPDVTPSQETATFTPEPNETLEPTETPLPDGGVYYDPLNVNTWQMFVDRVEGKYPGVDGRYQCIPRGMDFIWESRPVAGGDTPPYVNCDRDNRLGGVHRVELSNIAGTYTWRSNELVQLYADRCYLVKLVGDNRTELKPGENDQLYGTGFIYRNGQLLRRLPFIGFPQDDDLELWWSVMPSEYTLITFEVGFVVNYAVYGDGSIDVDEVYIEQVPLSDGFCDNPSSSW